MAAKTVQQLWTKYSSKKGANGMPPTKADVKMRDKHVSESVPYNTGHARDHLKSNVKQLKKLKVSNPKLAAILASKSMKTVHTAEKQMERFTNG